MSWRWLAVVCAAVSLVACIDGREEIWIERDGSGRLDLSYSIPASAALLHGGEAGVRQRLQDFLATATALSSSSAEVTAVGDRLGIRVRAAFDSALDLQEMIRHPQGRPLPAAATGLAGTVKLATRWLALDFKRTLTLSAALPGAALFPAAQFQNRKLTYILHLPESVTETNASRCEAGGRVLTWEIPLVDALKKPVTLHFTMPLPLPRWLKISGCGLAGFFAYLLFRRFTRNRCLHGHKAANSSTETQVSPAPRGDATRPEE